MIFLFASRDGVYHLIEIQINKKVGRFKWFFFDAVFSSFKEYAVESHENNTSFAVKPASAATAKLTDIKNLPSASDAHKKADSLYVFLVEAISGSDFSKGELHPFKIG